LKTLSCCLVFLLLLGHAPTASAQTALHCDETERKTFGEEMARALTADDWGWIEARIHAIDLPVGWQEMVRPLFGDFADRNLDVELLEFEQLPDYVRQPLRTLPAEVAERTRHGIRFSYRVSGDGLTESGTLSMPIYASPDGCRVLMAHDEE
jgi:hypothetical protein